jgi:hypothetical protein
VAPRDGENRRCRRLPLMPDRHRPGADERRVGCPPSRRIDDRSLATEAKWRLRLAKPLGCHLRRRSPRSNVRPPAAAASFAAWPEVQRRTTRRGPLDQTAHDGLIFSIRVPVLISAADGPAVLMGTLRNAFSIRCAYRRRWLSQVKSTRDFVVPRDLKASHSATLT